MALDLNVTNLSEKAEAGYEFELMLPVVNEGTGAFITVRGSNSPKVKEHSKRVYNKMQRKEAMAKRKGKEAEQMTLEEAEEMSIESALVRIVGWKGITEGKTVVDFTPDNAMRILKEHDWIRTAVLEESDNVANFI